MKGKWNKLIIIPTVLICLLCSMVLPYCISIMQQRAEAAGSSSLLLSGGYRPFLEYSDDQTFAMDRRTVIDVYIKAGETIYFGSDVYESHLDINNVLQQSISGVDIVLIKPDGTRLPFDVVQDGVGYIGTVLQESSGPNINGSNPSGYTPLSFTATETGVYQMHFHSIYGKSDTALAKNPVPILYNKNNWSSTGATVGAWDVTVTDEEYNIIRGRVFTKSLCLNAGDHNESAAINSMVYVVTTDGYIYETDFNGMMPYGFMFFANNRGLISTESNTPYYRSFRADNNDFADLPGRGVTYHNPWEEDTLLDQTFNIFFEMPDPELRDILFPTPYVPESARNLEFIGTSGTNSTHVGYGGFFKFDVVNATSATITLDMTDTVLSDNTHVNYGIRTLSNTVVEGTNYFHWDGKAADGTIVPTGAYNSGSISVTLETHAGEYHFPLFDVEKLPNGIRVTRVNPVYRESIDENGNIVNIDVSDEFENGKSVIYYDNHTQSVATGQQVGDGVDATAGVDSTGGAMIVGNSLNGDQTAIDLWTYSNNDSPITATISTPIIINDDFYSMITGNVFFDSDDSGDFDLSKSDYALDSVSVQLTYSYTDVGGVEHNETQTTQTDSAGNYRFFGIPVLENGNITTCTVEVIHTVDGWTVTTNDVSTNENMTNGTEIQTFTLGGSDGAGGILYTPQVEMSDVGYYFQLTDKPIKIKKDWVIDKYSDVQRPLSVEVLLQSYYIDAATSEKVISEQYSYILSNASGWTKTVSSLPKYADIAQTIELTYELTEERYTTRGTAPQAYTFHAGDSSAGFPYSTTFTVEDNLETCTYTVRNAPKTSVFEIEKRDYVDRDLQIAGVVFELWEATELTVIPTVNSEEYQTEGGVIYHLLEEKTTNANGYISFPGLLPNDYFAVETSAPAEYAVDTTKHHFTIANTDTFLTQFVYNQRQIGTLSIDKEIDQVIYGAQVPITVMYSDTADFANPTIQQYTVNITSGVLSYHVCDLTIVGQKYIKVFESPCSYVLNPTLSRLTNVSLNTVTAYDQNQVFQNIPGNSYNLKLYNTAQYVDTFYFVKLWVDSDGTILDESRYTTSGQAAVATAALNDMGFRLERSADDGETWETVRNKTNVNANMQIQANELFISNVLNTIGPSAKSTGTLIWTKRLGDKWWHLPRYNNQGVAYKYRIVETNTGNVGWRKYDGDITYETSENAQGKQETTATFINPATGLTDTFTSASALGVYKHDFQDNFVLINYPESVINYTMTVNKVEVGTNAPIPNVEFGTYRDVECTQEITRATTALDENNLATVSFGNLVPGTYYLKELSAPSGYTLPTEPITIVVGTDGSVTSDGAAVPVTERKFTITVENYHGFILPTLGGEQWLSWTVTALLLLLLALCAGILIDGARKILRKKA